MSVVHITNIKKALLANTDADDIMAVLVNKFSKIEDFRTALCDGDKCKRFFENINEVPKDQKQLWRLHYKIQAVCAADTCNIKHVQYFYAQRSMAIADYKKKEIATILYELDAMNISGDGKQRGGKQRGGNWLDIVRIIAGIEVALSKVGSTAVDAKNRLYALCQQVGSAIYKAPTAVSECLRALMGETLYKILKNMAKGAIGAGLLTEFYQNIGNIRSALLSIITYVPYAAGLLMMLSTGLLVFKLAEKLRDKVPGIVESVTEIVANAVNEIDASNINTITEQINGMQSKLVEKIQKKLTAASAAEKASIQKDLDEFNKTIHEILHDATLSPEAIAEQEKLMKDIDDRATEMVIKIQTNIFKKRQIDEHRQSIADNAMDTVLNETQGPVNVPPATTAMDVVANMPPPATTATDVVANISPATTAMDVANIPSATTAMDVANISPTNTILNDKPDEHLDKRKRTSANLEYNLSPTIPFGGKTHKKHHKKTHKKSAAKHHKKSHKKQRRSRKH